MMKFYILTVVLAAVHAKNFTVEREKDETCLILQLDGHVNLQANKTVSLTFDNATKIDSSNCTLIKLNLTDSVEVWFKFDDVSGQWAVTPIVQFVPETVFGIEDHHTEVVYVAKPLEKDFKKNESYQCLASTEIPFQQSPPTELNITVSAVTTNFKIQSVNSSNFVTGEECQKDIPSTSTPVSSTPVHTSPAPTTPQPNVKQNFSCEANNVTRFRVLGTFSLTITYNSTDGKTKTVTVPVPQALGNETECTSDSNETLVFTFFDGWRIKYIFKSDAPKSKNYYVSNITVTYVYDSNLPDSSISSGNATAEFGQVDYLKAASTGYYTCKDVSLALNQVTLHTKEFKYRAFNEKGDIDFKSGDITECPGDEETSSVVPIAVGAALAGLVVIVLIAYLIGRRRSRKAGYESV
jgi:lysosomal-associated membrane protein 1/2